MIFYVQVAREVSRALSHVVSCLPGQRVVERAIDDINAISKALNDPNVKVRLLCFPCVD